MTLVKCIAEIPYNFAPTTKQIAGFMIDIDAEIIHNILISVIFQVELKSRPYDEVITSSG